MDLGMIIVVVAVAGFAKGLLSGVEFVQNGRTNFRR
jgi:hypothetical protein